jgi:hypothetical protein
MPFSLLYSFFIGLTQFSFHVPGVWEQIEPFSDVEFYLIRVGFSKHLYPFALIGGQCLVGYFATIANFGTGLLQTYFF